MKSPQKVIKPVISGKADVQKRQGKQGNGPKGPLPLLRQKLSTLPTWVLILCAAAVALVIIVYLFSGPSQKEARPKAPPNSTAFMPGVAPERPTDQPTTPAQITVTPEEVVPAVRSIRLSPLQATRMDAIRAEVVAEAYANPSRITFAYVWKVNSRIVEGAAGDTLNLSPFKKGDLVTVTVTPHDGDKTGFPVDSPVAVIHGIPPSLDLQVPGKKIKAGEPLELQLVSLHTDSDDITFSLEAPLIPGMSVDSRTGKIIWIISSNQKGTIRFGAAVEDTDKTKVIKTFDITIE
jgi:hypothetical protein